VGTPEFHNFIMPEQLWITALLNHWFAGLANSVLGIFGIHEKYPTAPISNAFSMELLVFALLPLTQSH